MGSHRVEPDWSDWAAVAAAAGKNHPWILKINGHKYDEKKHVIWTVSNYLSTGYLLTIMRSSALMDTTSTRLRLSIPTRRGIVTLGLLTCCTEKASILSVVSVPNVHNLNAVTTKRHISPYGGTFYKTVLFQSVKVLKDKGAWESALDRRRPGKRITFFTVGSWIGFWAGKGHQWVISKFWKCVR